MRIQHDPPTPYQRYAEHAGQWNSRIGEKMLYLSRLRATEVGLVPDRWRSGDLTPPEITTYTDNNNAAGGGAAGGVAHVVVDDDVTIDPGDQSVIDRLNNDLGYTVTVVDDGAPENVAGADLVVITQSVGTSQVTGKYIDEAIPVLTMSAPSWDEHNLVANQSASYPYTTSDTLDIEQPSHPTVDGATAPHATTGVTIGYALDTDVPADADIVAASKASRPERASLVVFETGDNDAAGTPVPAPRALLGYHRNAIGDLTTGGGWKIFDNTIAWLHPTPAGGPSTPTYDAAGRLTSLGDTTITYDAKGHATQIVVTDGTATTTQDRIYNGDGQLVDITIAHPDTTTETHHLVWDTVSPATQVLAHSIDSQTNNYLYGNQREAVNRPDGTTDLFAHDHHGSTVATTATADIVAGSGYDAYGTPTGGVDPATVGFGYRGELHTGPAVHLRSREYLPQHGIFTTLDPLPSVPGSPTTANPYHYVNNSPVNSVDPLGLRPTDTEFGLILRWGWEHRDGIALVLTAAGVVVCGPACLAAGGLIGFASSAYGCSNGSNWDCGMVIVDVATLGGSRLFRGAQYLDDSLQLIDDLPAGALDDLVSSGGVRGLSASGGIIEQTATNAAGGRIYTSTGTITQRDFTPIVELNSAYGSGDIHILSGAHGLPDGTIRPDVTLFNDDMARFGHMDRVHVYDVTTMTRHPKSPPY